MRQLCQHPVHVGPERHRLPGGRVIVPLEADQQRLDGHSGAEGSGPKPQKTRPVRRCSLGEHKQRGSVFIRASLAPVPL